MNEYYEAPRGAVWNYLAQQAANGEFFKQRELESLQKGERVKFLEIPVTSAEASSDLAVFLRYDAQRLGFSIELSGDIGKEQQDIAWFKQSEVYNELGANGVNILEVVNYQDAQVDEYN